MNSGEFSLTMSSWKHGGMALSSCVPMDFYDVFTHEFLPTLPTIRKSESLNTKYRANLRIYL